MRIGRRSDLPLAADESSRFMPWIVALMVYLAALALAGALVAHSAVERWSRNLLGSLTVEIMPSEDATLKPGNLRVESALALLLGTPGIASAEVLSDESIARLLSPWLGTADLGELPLPVLIDVRLKSDATVDLAALGARLADAVPGARLDDHQRWLQGLVSLGSTVELVAAAVLALIAAAAAAVTAFSTRTALAIHHGVIEVLHLIGAQDSYVARQFQAHALTLALRGGLFGLAAAAATILAAEYFGEANAGGLIPQVSLALWQWAALLPLPLASGLIAMLTARATVLSALARMV
jgi:cell division transport system permease protein